MKKITWELPFKTMEYLESLTTLLVNNPLIVLIVGIQDSEGVIDSCNIHLREIDEDMSEIYLHLGAALGSHATVYEFMQEKATTEEKEEQVKEEEQEDETQEELQEELQEEFQDEKEAIKEEEESQDEVADTTEEAQEWEEIGTQEEEEAKVIEEETQEEEEDLIIEGKDEEEEEKTIEIKVKKTKDISQARKLLRKLLENFKK